MVTRIAPWSVGDSPSPCRQNGPMSSAKPTPTDRSIGGRRGRLVPAGPPLNAGSDFLHLDIGQAPVGGRAAWLADRLRRAIADGVTHWIVATPGTLCHSVAVQACQAAGYQPVVRHQADDFTALLALVAAGQGVGLVPQSALSHPLPPVTLLPLPLRRRTSVAYRRGAADHPAVAACIAALRAAAGSFKTDHSAVPDSTTGQPASSG
ncbi:hypothetical protein C1I95_05370 [Micromonospora craterilacus]|uniref:LysR substrate-binding domain-containing protein n=1 Tax=Micromonospora craterilacus TaxID=1655439 RepID=A0A2W2F260_9ACTN|nr:hypothetical protein C1I95_05370 [Micromonospora craterilacus]